MSYDSHTNFAVSTIATGGAPSPATSGTSLTVQTGDGSKFPTAPFNAVCWPSGSQPTDSNAEIVRVTAISTDTFTITRAQESTSAQSIADGWNIDAAPTAKTFTDIEANATGGGGSSVPPVTISYDYGSMDSWAASLTNATYNSANGYTYYTIPGAAGNQATVYRNFPWLPATNFTLPWYFSTLFSFSNFPASEDHTETHRFVSTTNNPDTAAAAKQIGFVVSATGGTLNDTIFSTSDGTTEQQTTAAITWGANEDPQPVEVVYKDVSGTKTVEFWVSGVLKATHSTNVPPYASATEMHFHAISKYKVDSGTSNRYLRLYQWNWHIPSGIS